MSPKENLKINRYGTVLNVRSKVQELELGEALLRTTEHINDTFGLVLKHQKRMYLIDVYARLKVNHPGLKLEQPLHETFMNPDGGILSIVDKEGRTYPILITEVKQQGTNGERMKEGKAKQAMGNAIERLGKNVIGFRAAMNHEDIFPFLCFGHGWDFHKGSHILDRIRTISMLGPLNKPMVLNQGIGMKFANGSYYFRKEPWTVDEMVKIMVEISTRAINYYFCKYGMDHFCQIES